MMLLPVPALANATGTIALLPPASPTDVAVTADGRPRYHLVATIAGLPAPRSLGAFTAYVAWAYTLSLDSAVKLGPVANGRVDLGELDRAQFRVLITAEASPRVGERTGRIVLRGTSPAARLLAHRDLLQPSAPGALRSATTRLKGWPMPPMPEWMPMPPTMSGITPPVRPYLPEASNAPAATPSRVVHLEDGDTLALEAGIVTRTIADHAYTMFAFNGQYPGPLLDVPRGATIVVRFHNALDQPSAVHWHGVRLDNAFDGAVGVTQDAVPAGASFTYRVRFPDAGVYWYHPHVREDVQQNLGLFGDILVRPRTPAYYEPVSREEPLILSDLLVGDDGLIPFGQGVATHALMGRMGNLLLVNGEPRYASSVRPGAVVQYYLTNASNARLYNLSFAGARMKLIAADAGKLEREAWVESLVIGPAQRYVVDVRFPTTGRVLLLNRVQALDHMFGSYTPEVDTLGIIDVSGAPVRVAAFDSLRHNADVSTDIARFRRWFHRPPDHTIVLTLRTRDLPAAIANMLVGINAPIEWNDGMPVMNWASTANQVQWVLRDSATGRENMDIAWRFRAGDVVKLRIVNDPASSHAMDHPIHLHGQRFLVLDRDGVPNDYLGWKDTVVIPAGQTTDLLIDMSNPGRWMLHCHIAEHLGAGMMTAFTVDSATTH